MIIGNPFRFAFMIDMVPEWCNGPFKSGTFFICIDEVLFPRVLDNTTLNSDIFHFFESTMPSSLVKMPVNKALYEMSKEDAFIKMYDLSYPGFFFPEKEGSQSDYTYKASTQTIEDNGCYIFSVSDGSSVRVLGAEVFLRREEGWIRNPDLYVSEFFLSKKILRDYLSKLKEFYESFLVSHPVAQRGGTTTEAGRVNAFDGYVER